MTRKKIEEMAIILIEMNPEAYLKYKFMLLAEAKTHNLIGKVLFLEKLFAITDKKRPLLLEMH